MEKRLRAMSSQIPPIPSFFPLASFLEPRLMVGSQQLSRKRQLSLLKNDKKKHSKKQRQIENEEVEDESLKGEASKEAGDENDDGESTVIGKPLPSDSKPAKQFHGYYKKEIYQGNASYYNMVFQLRIQTKQGTRLEYIPITLPFATNSNLMKSMILEYPSFCSQDMPCFNHIFPKARLMVMGWDSDSCSIDLSNIMMPMLSTHPCDEPKTPSISEELEPNVFGGALGDFSGDSDGDCCSSSKKSDNGDWNDLFNDSSDEDDTFSEIDAATTTMAVAIVPLSSSVFIEPKSQLREIEDDSDIVNVGLWMTDKNPDDILSINIEIFPPANLILPHPKKTFRIQNACGSCTTPYQLNLSCFKHLSKKKKKFSACESLSTVTATFVLCLNRCRVDFRGVRSIEAMSHDWKLVSGLDISEVSTSIYLLVMKGCIGRSLMLTSETCFLANATASWCTPSLHFDDLCDILELGDIDWDKIFARPLNSASDATKKAKTQVIISRRGGVVIRMVFPKDTPWDILSERDVLSDCDRLLDLLDEILAGKVMRVSERLGILS